MKKENSKLLFLLSNLDIAVASITLLVLIALTCYGVIMRYVVGSPLTWLEEVQTSCMVWIVFAAGGAAFRTGSHVAIEMVVDMFSEKIQKLIEIFISIIVLLVLAYLFWQSIGFIQMFIKSGRATSMLKIPYSLVYGIAPISYLVMVISYFYAKYSGVKSEAKEAVEE